MLVRITNMMMVNSMNYNLNKNLNNMNTMYTKMSTGKSFQKSSENPVASSKSIRYTSQISEIEQYQSNAADAEARLDVTESAIDSVEDILERTRELLVQASNDTLSTSDRDAINAEIEELNDQLLEVSNTTYAGEYIFGGYNVTKEPFAKSDDDLLAYNDEIVNLTGPYPSTMSNADILSLYSTYETEQLENGASNENIIYRIGENSEVDVNIEGQEIFGIGEDSIFSVMNKISMAIDGQDSCKIVDPPSVKEEELDLSALIGDLDKCLENVRSVKADVGAKRSYVQMSSNRLSQDHYTYTSLLSTNEDADIAKVSMELANAESVYNASLAAGSKIIVPTLVDYL
jgi:flagellar hook-associated protein 3 FlgL